ncbi:MAG: hypothetical protein ABSC32_20285 [Steroidobacteraceae bacterium]|jgi:hypothetical protein
MKVITFTVCALALMSGCQRESGDANNPNPAVRRKAVVAVQRGPSLEELTAGMVEAATQGKSQTPVGLKFDLLSRPVQGAPLEIAIALLPGEAAGPATVEVSAPEALQVPAGDSKFEFPAVEPSQVYKHSITLTPTAEGVFLLTLTVNLKHDEVADTRVFSLPLIVAGTGAPPPSSSAIPPRTSASSPPG